MAGFRVMAEKSDVLRHHAFSIQVIENKRKTSETCVTEDGLEPLGRDLTHKIQTVSIGERQGGLGHVQPRHCPASTLWKPRFPERSTTRSRQHPI
jgi:hypothetical protein